MTMVLRTQIQVPQIPYSDKFYDIFTVMLQIKWSQAFDKCRGGNSRWAKRLSLCYIASATLR